jgi:hypothetical protein
MELLPLSALDDLRSVRSQFLRNVFDLPRATSHELAVVLLDLPPVDVTFFRRKRMFYWSVHRHDFSFVRDAMELDRVDLICTTTSFTHSLVRLARIFVPSISTVHFSSEAALLATVSELISDPDLSFYYVLHSDSDSLSFFRLFRDPAVLSSFRLFLSHLKYPQRRLVILFIASLLRYRFCSLICEFCPLCGRKWLWEHFFTCKQLQIVPIDEPRDVLKIVQTHIREGQWDAFLAYLRFYLLEWRDVVTTAIFSSDVIEGLA